MNSVENIVKYWIKVGRGTEKYVVRITKPVLNTFFEGAFIISIVVQEFYKRDIKIEKHKKV